MQRRQFVLALGACWLFAPAALAAPKAKPLAEAPEKQEAVVEVSVLHGTHDVKENDARIGNMPELREGPFAKYASYQLLSRSSLRLTKGGKRQLKLPNGRLLEAHLEDLLADGTARLVASINRPGASDFLPLLEVKAKVGQSFIVAGQSYRKGVLVLVFKVLK